MITKTIKPINKMRALLKPLLKWDFLFDLVAPSASCAISNNSIATVATVITKIYKINEKRKKSTKYVEDTFFLHTLYFLFQLVFVFQKADDFGRRKIGSENNTGVIYISSYITEKTTYSSAQNIALYNKKFPP